jgi:hypothetical protein
MCSFHGVKVAGERREGNGGRVDGGTAGWPGLAGIGNCLFISTHSFNIVKYTTTMTYKATGHWYCIGFNLRDIFGS